MYWIGRDVQYGARLLWKAPGFSALALLALGLGMGATTAIFSAVDAVILKPLPYRDPQRLLIVWEKNPIQNKFKLFVAPANFRNWQHQSRSFENMAAIQDIHYNLTGGPNGHIEPEEIRAERVSAELFPLLGVQPVIGRAFRPEEDQPGHANFVLISHHLWQRRFASDPSLPGKSIRLRDQDYMVLGVLPDGFSVLDPLVDIYLPIALNTSDPRSAGARNLMVVARLKPGLDIGQARVEMESIGKALELANPALNRGWRPSLFPFREELVGKAQQALLVLLGAVVFLLLMACANVANLMLARGATRRKEMAVRTALGASRSRIITQLLSESMLLALAGGVLGLLLARGGLALLARLGSDSIPLLSGARVDVRLFLFALAASVVTGVLSGIAPAIHLSSTNLNAVLREGGRGGTTGRRGRAMRSFLVVLEVTLSVVVLIGAGLLIRSFVRLRATDPGFQANNLLTFRLLLGGTRNASPERRIAFVHQVSERMSTLPGVRTAGGVNWLPLDGLFGGTTFTVEGAPEAPGDQRPVGLIRSVTPSYFRTMGIPVIAGRVFTDEDTAVSPPVIVVSQSLARQFFTVGQPVGGRLFLRDLGAGRIAEVVGVVGDVKPERIENEDRPTIYGPYPQLPFVTMVMVLRTAGSPLSLSSTVEKEVHRLDPDQPLADIRSMEMLVDQSIAGSRFNAVLLAVFASVAFVMAALGIYGVVSYDVTERTHEIGLRLALGADRKDVLRLVVGQGARLAAFGIAAGLSGAIALTRLMVTMLYGVKATDAYTFAAISLLLGLVALLACYLPARRALAFDPVIALRHE
ncbi:MAG TPA: ABC transporter permease [Bryobacteraceae bacterium]|nr:ABC transporter permease [Bryobacteraceae bacterium]